MNLTTRYGILFMIAASVSVLFPVGIDSEAPGFHRCEERPERVPPAVVSPGVLRTCYPEFISDVDETHLTWHDGTVMELGTLSFPGDPAEIPDSLFESLLSQCSLRDQLSQRYPPGENPVHPVRNSDPGRMRHLPFFQRMYGSTPDDVRRNLVPIEWLPSTRSRRVLVTTINGVHEKLAAVARELAGLPGHLRACVDRPAGTFVWRTVEGVERMSAHSFGIAIDINISCADYWRWHKPDGTGNYLYRNRVPPEIVRIFEKHGFIWGGKWYHHDTMHFEYRPELLYQDGGASKAMTALGKSG